MTIIEQQTMNAIIRQAKTAESIDRKLERIAVALEKLAGIEHTEEKHD